MIANLPTRPYSLQIRTHQYCRRRLMPLYNPYDQVIIDKMSSQAIVTTYLIMDHDKRVVIAVYHGQYRLVCSEMLYKKTLHIMTICRRSQTIRCIMDGATYCSSPGDTSRYYYRRWLGKCSIVQSYSSFVSLMRQLTLLLPFKGAIHGWPTIASGILIAELDDIIAGRMTEMGMGLHLLQTIVMRLPMPNNF